MRLIKKITEKQPMDITEWRTTNRAMESFLYAHQCRATRYGKNEDGMTYWVYPNTPEVMEIVDEYHKIQTMRKENRWIN